MVSAIRSILVLAYFAVTVVNGVSIIFRGSVGAGVAVLAASALSYCGAAALLGSVMERRTKGYRAIDLIGIGTLAMILVAVALALAYRSDFQIYFFGYVIGGFSWALIGMAAALIATNLSVFSTGRG
jgi:hypothetical protein